MEIAKQHSHTGNGNMENDEHFPVFFPTHQTESLNNRHVMSQGSAEVRLGKSESVCSFGEESITVSLLSATVHSPANPHKHDCLNAPRPVVQHRVCLPQRFVDDSWLNCII